MPVAYTINKTDGSVLTTVADGTINTDTSIVIVGKNYAGYGEFLGENYIHLLENGSNTTSPANPLQGQLWFDSASGVLKVYNGSTFKNLGSASTDVTEPTSAVIGDLWFDPNNAQLYVYDGANWILVGPSFTAGSGVSGSIVDTVQDNVAVDHIVVKLYVEDDLVGTISKDAEFTPATAISGFPTIKPGIQLASSVNGQSPLFEGFAREALFLNGIDSDGFLSSTTNDSTTGTIAVLNDTGLRVGADQDAKISVNGNDVYVENTTSDGNLLLQVNDGGSPTTVITIDGASGRALINSSPTVGTGIADKNYVDAAVASGIGGGLGGVLLADGSEEIAGTLLPDTNTAYNFGSASRTFNNIYATNFIGESTSAQYADLAERFEIDTAQPVGTVVELGGAKEITESLEELSDNVFGVISTRAAYLMNAGAGDDESHPAVAMSGRVPVRVVGTINKGDRLVSAGEGLAKAAQSDEITPFNVIGRALESKDTVGPGVVEAIVRIN